VSGYRRVGSDFVLIASASTTTQATGFVIDFAGPAGAATGNMAIAFDNFKVNAGTAVCPGQGFDFALDSLRIDGNVNVSGNSDGTADFFDDFSDNSLTAFPTSQFTFLQPTSESGGFLRLSSADGANTFTPGFLVDNCQLGLAMDSPLRLVDGAGNSVVTASFRADTPLQGQGYGLQIFTFGTNEVASMSVNYSLSGPVVGVLGAGIPLNLAGVQRVMLRLTFDDFDKSGNPIV
jgi:hypothetical protein